MCRQSDDLHRQSHTSAHETVGGGAASPDLRLAAIEYLAEKDLSMTSSKQRRLGVVALGASFVALSGYAGLSAACTGAVK